MTKTRKHVIRIFARIVSELYGIRSYYRINLSVTGVLLYFAHFS